jgi:phage I-like protein
MPIKINKKNKSERVELIRVGNFERRFEEDLKITLLDLEKMKQNFDSNARRQKLDADGGPVLPFNFGHNTWDEAAGWITSLKIDKDVDNFDALFASVDWTPRGAQKIRDNEFKFVSSEFTHNFKDPETGKIYDIILGGAALTNIPFIRDMEAVNLLSEKENGQRTFVSLKLSGDKPDDNFNQGVNMPKELIEKFKSMSPEEQSAFLAECGLMKEDAKLSEELTETKTSLKLAEDKIKTLETDLSGSSDAADKLKLAEGKIEEQGKQLNELIAERAKERQEASFNLMLSEGKACEAQRGAYMKGDMDEFAKKAQPVKLDESGAGDQGEDGADVQDKVLKLAEKKRASDKQKLCGFELTLVDAIESVFDENPELRKKYNEEA